MKIYTKTGDRGMTSIIGGHRISKADLRIDAYGTLDELTAFEGELYNRISANVKARDYLLWVINRTMDCASLIASDGNSTKKLPQITEDMVNTVERMIDALLEGIPQISNFTLPIGSTSLSSSHICRTICRRAERCIVRLIESGVEVDCNVQDFINRLSDFFYALGRQIVYFEKINEVYWTADKGNQ